MSCAYKTAKMYWRLQSLYSILEKYYLLFQMISKYLANTHAATHNQYNMELLDVFALDHEKKSFTDVGNR